VWAWNLIDWEQAQRVARRQNKDVKYTRAIINAMIFALF